MVLGKDFKKSQRNRGPYLPTVMTVCLVMIVIVGIYDINAFKGQQSSGAKSHENISKTAIAKEDQSKQSVRVPLTDNYIFFIPSDAVPYDIIPEDDGLANEQILKINEGETLIRSFIITDEPGCFPNLVEYFYKDSDTKVTYSEFFDTSLATAQDETEDSDGRIMYRISYFWPDGTSTLCSISVQSYEQGCLNIADQIINSVEYRGEDNHKTEYSNESTEIRVDNKGHIIPSQEEINEAMMHEVQEAYNEYLNEQWNSQPHVFPYF